jgi:hypothetical protein
MITLLFDMVGELMDRMEFVNEAIPELPPQAWLFERIAAGKGRLLHGPAVYLYNDGFVEGCLAAKAREDLRGVAHVFGSGLSTRGHSWLFITPSHTAA